jgi:type II secretory pathway pseudopilin PulG
MNNRSTQAMKNNLENKYKKQDEGFSLIESVIAIATMGICLSYAMPLILYSKINNNKSEVRAGALMVSQKIFDSIRSQDFAAIPKVDTTVNSLPVEQTSALGRNYIVEVRYCDPAGDVCTDDYRTFQITIRDPKGSATSNESIVYQTQAAFTDFK